MERQKEIFQVRYFKTLLSHTNHTLNITYMYMYCHVLYYMHMYVHIMHTMIQHSEQSTLSCTNYALTTTIRTLYMHIY